MAKGPKDTNQMAFDAVGRLTGGSTSSNQERAKKGGEARSAALTPEQRSEIARKAAETRWHKKAA